MNTSDLQYLSRFALDPEIEYGGEDPYGVDISYDFYNDDEAESFDDDTFLASEDEPPEDDFLFEN